MNTSSSATPFRLSVAMTLALCITACATQTPRDDAQESTPKMPEAPAASATPASLPSIEEAYYANRGAASGFSSLGFLTDFGGFLYGLGAKSSEIYGFEATSGKFLSTVPTKGTKFGANAFLRTANNIVYVIDTENSRIELISHDFRNIPLGDLPFTLVKNPVAVEVYVSEVPSAVRFNFIVDSNGKRNLVQVDLTGAYGGTPETFKPALAVFSNPIVMPLPDSAAVGETAAVKTELSSQKIWVASGKTLYALNADGTPDAVEPFRFETPIYGLDVMTCRRGDQLGYWMVGTKAPSSGAPAPFYMIDRGTLKAAGGFTSPVITEPSDMVFKAQIIAEFTDGAVFVANAGTGVVAVDWKQVAEANNLRKRCF
jgi:hypothetical protein